MILLRLFWEFFKTGLFAVGGGMATLPFLYDISDRTGWFTHQQLADMVAVSESTPGPIGVNMATYVGFVTAGVPGAIVSTLGLVCPSIIIILLVYMFLKAFRNNKYVNAAFYGIRPASAALIAAAGLILVRITFLTNAVAIEGGTPSFGMQWKALALAVVILAGTHLIKKIKNLHPILWIALSAIVGIVFKF